jgi:hypothetical protein
VFIVAVKSFAPVVIDSSSYFSDFGFYAIAYDEYELCTDSSAKKWNHKFRSSYSLSGNVGVARLGGFYLQPFFTVFFEHLHVQVAVLLDPSFVDFNA